MKLNIAASVILYNPKDEDIQNIFSYLNKVKKLYVFDNTEGKSNEKLFNSFSNIDYFWENENKGLSIRLNESCKLAIHEGYDYLLTMDQDSSFLNETIDLYFDNIINFPNKEMVAMYGLEFSNVEKPNDKSKTSYKQVNHLITSGTVMNLNLFNSIGGFDENLFIDGVDIDYCYAALLKGYKNIEFQNIFFKHLLGESVFRASIFSLFLIKKNRHVHSNIRIYYMQRNLLYLEKKYATLLPELMIKLRLDYEYHIKTSIKYSSNIFNALKYKFEGMSDFKSNKMGKKSNNHRF